nr:putative reverse transcriptase, RNA-dependent DNA polymerase [Tanacetum cinerariifolium]GEZ06923.1 putative reverse transcriptase, RNA-dependent DNA polymerase [Tanacetum cinerariifolium]
MIRVAIGEKSKALLSHLTSDPLEQSSETYEQWEQEDLIVFSWLIQNIEPTLAGNLTKYHTAKTLWDALAITYNNERDKLLTFNLHDIRTGAIIGRGTERKGLYYVDEVTRSGTVMLSHETAEREAWLWHRRPGHPSTANKGWPLHQFDVKNAFLHGELKEEFYMEALHGFTNNFGEREACLVKKPLYGLKQSPKAWFGRFTLAMKHYRFRQRNDNEEITKLKKSLFTEFEMKDLGRLKYFLGIEVLRSKQRIFMYQKKYVLDLLAEIDWAGDKGDQRSTSGYYTLVGGNLVTWRSKKQKVVALSSAEAEF